MGQCAGNFLQSNYLSKTFFLFNGLNEEQADGRKSDPQSNSQRQE